MRPDSIGLFWQDIPRGPGERAARVMPEIPETGWKAPTEFPNLAAAKALSIDVETWDPELKKHGPGWARGKGHLVGIAAGTDDGRRWYFPMRHEVMKEDNLDPEHVLAWARDNLCDPRQPKLGANIGYDVGWLREEGVHVQGPLHDVQYAEALLHEARTVALEDLGERYLGEGKVGALLYDWCSAYYAGSPTHLAQGKNIYRCPPCIVGPYAESDVDLPFRVLERQWPLLHNEQLWDLYDMECRLIYLMIEMRYAGVQIDVGRAEQLQEVMIVNLAEVDAEIKDMVGFEVNTSASESLARAFDEQGIPYGYTSPSKNHPQGQPSFTKTMLKACEHPLAGLVRRKKEYEKLKGTFIESYLLDSHVNGKVYCSFPQLRSDSGGARSGRFASSNPNLQNIPIRSKLGKMIRTAFIPDYGHLQWIKADYSQIEYRILAHFAHGPGADAVRRLYIDHPETDFHTMMHDIILEGTGQDLERIPVKTVNFGTAYGMGVGKLATDLNISMKKAKELLATIHGAAPFLKNTMKGCMDEAERIGYITTIMGRRSRFDSWVPQRYAKDSIPVPFEQAILMYANPKRAFLHKALNRRLQGSAADLIKNAMLECWDRGLFKTVGVPRLTVHDELDFSDPGGHEKTFAEIYRVMETAIPFSVPVVVEQEIGPNWGDVEKVA